MKRFSVTGITRDREYDVTKGTSGSRIVYFSANPNGEAETLKILLKPKARLRKVAFEIDMGELAIRGRQAIGNIPVSYTHLDVYKRQPKSFRRAYFKLIS